MLIQTPFQKIKIFTLNEIFISQQDPCYAKALLSFYTLFG